MNPFEIIKTVRLTEKGTRQAHQEMRAYERGKDGKPVLTTTASRRSSSVR